QALPAAFDRLAVERPRVAAHPRADAQLARRPPGQEPFERGAALDQRPIAQVGLAVAQQIERNVGYRRRRRSRLRALRALRRGSAGEVDASLQLLETGRLAARVERHDISVVDAGRLECERPLA